MTAKRELFIILMLVIAVLSVYWRTYDHSFIITFDDNHYVFNNRHVHEGLTADSLKWAFSLSGRGEMTYWHPLTWISHMLDYRLFELNAGMHHLSNVFYHLINTVLLFLVLRLMTGTVWRSAFVAGLFAIHPVNVDTVAWIAERKNLLSTTFWMLTTICYVYYLRKPQTYRYLLVCAVFIMGLLAKPMLVTLPFVFMLLDLWPLNRLSSDREGEHAKGKGDSGFISRSIDIGKAGRAILEKIPLIAFSFISIYLSSMSLKNMGSSVTKEMVPIPLRIENALVSCLSYIFKLFCPSGLIVYHPYPVSVPLWQAFLAFVILCAISLAVLYNLKKRPYIFVGWFWFLGTLVPVSGILQAGLWPAYAERWAYVPFIGLFVVLAWGAHEFTARFKINTYAAAGAAAFIMSIMLGLTWIQIGYWKDEIVLYNHAISVNSDNAVVHYNLGVTYSFKGMKEEAIAHYREALRIAPNHAEIYHDMGMAYYDLKNMDEAVQCFRKAIELKPDYENPRLILSDIAFRNGDNDGALKILSETLKNIPGNLAARNKMGIILTSSGKTDEALVHFNQVLESDPAYKNIHNSIGNVYLVKSEYSKAVEEFSKEIKAYPKSTDAYINIGIAFMSMRRAEEAIGYLSQAAALDPTSARIRAMLEKAVSMRSMPSSFSGAVQDPVLSQPIKGSEDITALHKQAIYHASRKEYEKALDLLMKMVKAEPNNPEGYYNIACIYSLRNEPEQSAEWIKKALDKGFKDMKLIRNDADLQNLRSSGYYKDLIK